MTHGTNGLDVAPAGARQAVLIIDDHPLYRSGLKAALAPLPADFDEAASVLGAIDALGARRFDLIVYDWYLPDGGGCKGLVAIRQLAPGVPLVVISADEDDTIAFAAAAIGAVGCLRKSIDAQGLRQAIGRLLRTAPGEPQQRKAAQPSAAAPTVLTRRQRDVLDLMACGGSNKRIAMQLGIAEATVRAHVSDLLQLLQARNRTEAVV